MSPQTMDPAQICALEEHYAHAAALSADRVTELRMLAEQLDGRAVLPIFGAGGSHDCGMRLASQIGADLYDEYMADPSYRHAQGLVRGDLGLVAEAIASERGQEGAVRALGLTDPDLWPATDGITDHFCAYRVMARFAREGQLEEWREAISFNYDCSYEGGLKAEGFLRSSYTAQGREWYDHARVIADAPTATADELKAAFNLFKVHGCAENFRRSLHHDPARAADSIILQRPQLLRWRNDWAQNVFRDRAQSHVLLLVGFSGLDAVIYSTIEEVLRQVYSQNGAVTRPRVVVVDHSPDTAPLRGLVRLGIGGATSASGITQVSSNGTTTTAVVLTLLAEWLARKLASTLATYGVALPSNTDARLAALTIATPVMLRWSYLLRRPSDEQFAQYVNLQQAAQRGYVPLTLSQTTTARALRARIAIREALGRASPESISDALANHGFVVDASRAAAYLPVGLDHAALLASCRGGAKIDLARPQHLECILVSDDDGRRGVHVDTGREVPVP